MVVYYVYGDTRLEVILMNELMKAIDFLKQDFANRVPRSKSEAFSHASFAAQQCLQAIGKKSIMIAKTLKQLEFVIWDRDFDGDKNTSAVMAINANEKYPRVIGINIADSYEHQRFSLAHELGHFIFDIPLGSQEEEIFVQYNTAADNENDLVEYRANKFAACLLMPESEFIQAWNRLSSFKEIGTRTTVIAKLFRVPVTAARRRVMELGL